MCTFGAAQGSHDNGTVSGEVYGAILTNIDVFCDDDGTGDGDLPDPCGGMGHGDPLTLKKQMACDVITEITCVEWTDVKTDEKDR